MSNVKIEASWKMALEGEFDKPYMQVLRTFLTDEKSKGKNIYPPGSLIFNAFNLTPFDQVKVVIIGQDPYHNPNEAMGLSFSVPRGIRVPPSLRNIYKELHNDIDFEIPNHGDLSSWARNGVLLLNAMLTVEHKMAGSHRKIGWQQFTDQVIRILSEERNNLVFLLWGRFAQSKVDLIDSDRHLILQAAHPSPLARNAFSGCSHFSKTNAYLKSVGKDPVVWQLPT